MKMNLYRVDVYVGDPDRCRERDYDRDSEFMVVAPDAPSAGRAYLDFFMAGGQYVDAYDMAIGNRLRLKLVGQHEAEEPTVLSWDQDVVVTMSLGETATKYFAPSSYAPWQVFAEAEVDVEFEDNLFNTESPQPTP